jgi:hypothetical protein
MIKIKQIDPSFFPQYDMIPMRVRVECEYKLIQQNKGLGGVLFAETTVAPYIKNFCVGKDESVTRWNKWDLSGWASFMAFDGEAPVGPQPPLPARRQQHDCESRCGGRVPGGDCRWLPVPQTQETRG